MWGNTRITYADNDGDGKIDIERNDTDIDGDGDLAHEIRREQNYYPFGLQHKGYNNTLRGVKNNLKTYQGQEFTEDLGLNTHEWRYRVSDPAIGRFWQIDPLAEDYMYNSTYAFAENKLGMGIELEGAEIFTWLQQKLVENTVENPNGASAHVMGVAQGVGQSIQGTVDAISDPVGTAKGVANLAVAAASQGNVSTMMQADAALGTNSLQTADAMVTAVEQGANDLVNGNGVERGNVIGQIGAAIVGTKGTTAATKAITTAAKTTKVVTVTEKVVAKALKNSPMKTIQSEVSLPVVQRYVDRLNAGETPPAIKVDNGVIVDGNHRFVAGQVVGKTPPTTPGVVPRSSRPLVRPVSELKVNPIDYGNQ